jgi:hypothetical protein
VYEARVHGREASGHGQVQFSVVMVKGSELKMFSKVIEMFPEAVTLPDNVIPPEFTYKDPKRRLEPFKNGFISSLVYNLQRLEYNINKCEMAHHVQTVPLCIQQILIKL